MVKHKSKYRCENAIYFELGPDIIKDNCKFAFYFYKTDITPLVLNRGDEIILAMSVMTFQLKFPSHLYVLVNRSALCDCRIEAENNFLLESLAACHEADSKLVMFLQ